MYENENNSVHRRTNNRELKCRHDFRLCPTGWRDAANAALLLVDNIVCVHVRNRCVDASYGEVGPSSRMMVKASFRLVNMIIVTLLVQHSIE